MVETIRKTVLNYRLDYGLLLLLESFVIVCHLKGTCLSHNQMSECIWVTR